MSTKIGLGNLIGMDGGMQSRAFPFQSGLSVFVIFTSIRQTLPALERACQLANSLSARVEIVALEAVPFALSLEDPPVSVEFLVKQLEMLASRYPVQTKISVLVCRDPLEALLRILSRDCPVVMGIRKRWWRTHDDRVAQKLRRAGYNLVLVNTE
jgi:hypothetical protein